MTDIREVCDPKSLQSFLSTAQFPPTFRYWDNRGIDVLEHHVVTLLAIDVDETVGYAHIDRDGRTFWLGICVLDGHQSRGVGSQLMARLHEVAYREGLSGLKLSVDCSNVGAIRFYERWGFMVSEYLDRGILFMLKSLQSTSCLEVPVSIGEALDKLSILEIKLRKINDPTKLAFIRSERDALASHPVVSMAMSRTRFYFDRLVAVNERIWDDQDVFRELTLAEGAGRQALCERIIEDNDRRFRIKNKINNLSKSLYREQKGYEPKVVTVEVSPSTDVDKVRDIALDFDVVVLVGEMSAAIRELYEQDESIVLPQETEVSGIALSI